VADEGSGREATSTVSGDSLAGATPAAVGPEGPAKAVEVRPTVIDTMPAVTGCTIMTFAVPRWIDQPHPPGSGLDGGLGSASLAVGLRAR
jgi:hypothetical protein